MVVRSSCFFCWSSSIVACLGFSCWLNLVILVFSVGCLCDMAASSLLVVCLLLISGMPHGACLCDMLCDILDGQLTHAMNLSLLLLHTLWEMHACTIANGTLSFFLSLSLGLGVLLPAQRQSRIVSRLEAGSTASAWSSAVSSQRREISILREPHHSLLH